jgi:hypothetical protein
MTIYNNTISRKSFKQRQLIDFLSILRGIVVQVFQVLRNMNLCATICIVLYCYLRAL